MTDLYLYPNCLFIELAEEEFNNCPKCGKQILFVDADLEFKHFVVDVLTDHGCEIASTTTIFLSLTHPLYVEIRRVKNNRLTEEELRTILRKHENHVKNGIEGSQVFLSQSVNKIHSIPPSVS